MKARPATLVVIEFGASWPRWLNPAHTGDLAVVAQHYEGLPTDLVTQVAQPVRVLVALHLAHHAGALHRGEVVVLRQNERLIVHRVLSPVFALESAPLLTQGGLPKMPSFCMMPDASRARHH